MKFRVGASEFYAPLLYASPSQINGLIPDALPPGSAEVRVRTVAGESAAQPVLIVAARFTVFTTTRRPFGPAIIQQQNRAGLRLNRMLDPAAR